MDSQDKATKIKILYDLLTELEKIGCFEIKTNCKQRLKIAEYLLEVIEGDLEEDLLEKKSERWL